MFTLVKFLIRLGASLLGAKILMHFFPFLGNSHTMWLILTGFLLVTAYGLEFVKSGRYD
ncbi:MAG: hypothetical protein LWW94_10245 [Candidatus Desulfofervidaceae bacterium]|nr:hypothetical protein [Candidatus Desulfofervidaceae bacterium]